MIGEEDLVLDLEEPVLERLCAELTPVSLLSELRLKVAGKAGSELTRCIIAGDRGTSAMSDVTCGWSTL